MKQILQKKCLINTPVQEGGNIQIIEKFNFSKKSDFFDFRRFPEINIPGAVA